MKTFIEQLIQLADGLDSLGLKKDADKLDQLISVAARGDGEDFGSLMSLFDEPAETEDGKTRRHRLEMEDENEGGPSAEKVMLDEPEVHTPLAEEEAPLAEEKGDVKNRLKMIKRRHELVKLKKQLEKAEKEEAKEIANEEMPEEVVLPIASPEELDFEDEDMAANEADDGLIGKLKDILKGAPELAKQLLTLVKDNPELLELLAL